MRDEALTLREGAERIWFENEKGEERAYVEFPAFEKDKVEVTHTVVSPALEGRGIAGELTAAMAEKLRREGKKAELTCSYAVVWFARHPEYADVLLDPEAECRKAENMTARACGIPKHRKK